MISYTSYRVLESTLRTTNNLLERLHASFFFYLLVGTTTFMKIGSYLPAPILVSTAMLFSGLGEWTQARWVQEADVPDEKGNESAPGARWVQRKRPVLPALVLALITHLNGALLFSFLVGNSWITAHRNVSTKSFLSVPLIAEGSSSSRILCSWPFPSNSLFFSH